MKQEKQPAKISYFFGPGWKDLGRFIKIFWKYNQKDIKKRAEKVEHGKGIMSISGIGNLLSCIAVILFATLFFCLITVGVSAVLGVAFLIMYILIGIIWMIDRCYLLKNRIFVACPNCKGKYLIPTYVCVSCGEKHTKLTPGKYGTFYRICNCGENLPTHCFTKRGHLDAECPNCGISLKGTDSRPICIPIIGGRSSGKTAYITAFSYDFIEKVAPRNGLEIRHYNKEMEKFYKDEICNDYLGGTTRMTKTELDLQQASTKAFNFIVRNNKLNPDRLIQIYDVAGESFVDNTENEEQLQYKYCHGIIFMLDPLSIPEVRNRLDDAINEIDKASVGVLDIDLVLDSFMNKLREITGCSTNDAFSIPIAIVVSKGDIKTLDEFIGEDVVSDYMAEHEMDMNMYTVAEDEIIRRFLIHVGLEKLVRNIDMRFKNNRYFKCSAIGHTRDLGRYNPKGVLEPMEWIVKVTDNGMKAVWNEHQFRNVKRGKE